MKKRMRYVDQKGFSLIELFITICMLAIVAAFAFPALQGYAINRSLESAARDIESDFFELKERAIAENRMYRITFSPGTNDYTIAQCNTTESPCATYTNILTKSPVTFGNNIQIAALGSGTTVTQYTFQKRGTMSAGTVRIIFNDRPSWAEISTSLTGRINVQFTMQ